MVAIVLVICMIVLVLLQDFLYRRFWSRKLSYDLSLSGGAVFENDKIIISETLTNGKYMPLPFVHVSFRIPLSFLILDGANRIISVAGLYNSLFIIPMNKSMIKKTRIMCTKRGYYTINGISLTSSNPLLTKHLYKPVPDAYYVTVYPKCIQADIADAIVTRLSDQILAKRYLNPDPFEFKGIREYQPYDSLKQINFKASAKTGSLMSNVYDYTISKEVRVILNLRDYCIYKRNFVHENAIRLAAYISRRFIGEGVPVAFATNRPSVVTNECASINAGRADAHLDTIYTALAHIDLTHDVIEYEELLPSPTMADACSIVLVSSYHADDLKERFLSLTDAGVSVSWIIPASANDTIELSGLSEAAEAGDVVVWEVEDDAQ